MKYDPEKHDRHSIRLPGYDYKQGGAYFVTMVTHGRDCLFDDAILRETQNHSGCDCQSASRTCPSMRGW
jgi:putative transposase